MDKLKIIKNKKLFVLIFMFLFVVFNNNISKAGIYTNPSDCVGTFSELECYVDVAMIPNCISSTECCIPGFCNGRSGTCTVETEISPLMNEVFINFEYNANGPAGGCLDSASPTDELTCNHEKCPSGLSAIYNGGVCTVREIDAADGDIIYFNSGNFDITNNKCIKCNGLTEGVANSLCGDDSQIYLNNLGECSNNGDGLCESACGVLVDPLCDELPAGGVACDATCQPTAGCTDIDGDGYLDSACGGNDCDETDITINPGATDICGDGIDQDCSGSDCCIPTGPEICDDGVDNDCNGFTDCADTECDKKECDSGDQCRPGKCIGGSCVPLANVCGGLIPCGRMGDNPATSWDDSAPCEFCHGIMLLNQGMNFLMKIAGVVAVLALIITGLLFIFSAGNPELKNTAKTSLKWIIFGFLILSLSWLIVDFLLSAWGYLDPLGGKWNVVCD